MALQAGRGLTLASRLAPLTEGPAYALLQTRQECWGPALSRVAETRHPGGPDSQIPVSVGWGRGASGPRAPRCGGRVAQRNVAAAGAATA